jgi:hypothetical protein
MASNRQAKINEELAKELAKAVRELKDPRISSSVVSITGVDCAKDLKTANVYFSFFSVKSAAHSFQNPLFIRHFASLASSRKVRPFSFDILHLVFDIFQRHSTFDKKKEPTFVSSFVF